MYKPRSIIKPSEERLLLGLQIYNFFLNAQKFVDNLSKIRVCRCLRERIKSILVLSYLESASLVTGRPLDFKFMSSRISAMFQRLSKSLKSLQKFIKNAAKQHHGALYGRIQKRVPRSVMLPEPTVIQDKTN